MASARFEVPSYFFESVKNYIFLCPSHERYALYNRDRLIQCYQILSGIPEDRWLESYRYASLDLPPSHEPVLAYQLGRASPTVWLATHPRMARFHVHCSFSLRESEDTRRKIYRVSFSRVISNSPTWPHYETRRELIGMAVWDSVLVHPGSPVMHPSASHRWTSDLFGSEGAGAYDAWIMDQKANTRESWKNLVLARLCYAIAYFSN